MIKSHIFIRKLSNMHDNGLGKLISYITILLQTVVSQKKRYNYDTCQFKLKRRVLRNYCCVGPCHKEDNHDRSLTPRDEKQRGIGRIHSLNICYYFFQWKNNYIMRTTYERWWQTTWEILSVIRNF